jgi:hypothetical protein
VVQIPLKSEWNYSVKSVLDCTEPVNFTSAYISPMKEVKYQPIEKK